MEAKLDWIQALSAAGLQEIKVDSFLSPRLLQQMADCAALFEEANKIESLMLLALVPYLKSAEGVIAAGARKGKMLLSASRAHGLNSIGENPEEVIDVVGCLCASRD